MCIRDSPLEASGTSGEKALMNGVVNFSVLDGWWLEGYREGAQLYAVNSIPHTCLLYKSRCV